MVWDYKFTFCALSCVGKLDSLNFSMTTLFSFFIFIISLAVPGLSCDAWDRQCLLLHVGSLAVACKLLVVAYGI